MVAVGWIANPWYSQAGRKKEIKQATWSRKLQNGKTDIYMTAMAVSKLGPEIGNQ